MKKEIFFPALLVVCSVVSVAVCRSPYTYFNLLLAVVILCVSLFSRQKDVAKRIKYSALWFLLLELLALVLLLFGENIYYTPTVWSMYLLIALLDVLITPQIKKKW